MHSRSTNLRTISSAVAVCLMCLISVEGVALNLFYPYGPINDDTVMDMADDGSSDEIDLTEDFILYNKPYKNIYVNVNGHVSFDSEVPAYRADKPIPMELNVIAIFLADIDTRAGGRISYRATSDPEIIQRASVDIQTYFSGFENYVPTAVFIATWDRVGYYDRNSSQSNTFQVVLVSDGKDSFSLFHYLDSGIQWYVSQGKYKPTYMDIPPQAGFEGNSSGKEKYFTLPGSGDTGKFVTGSNVNIPGVWMFHIGDTGKGNVRPADLNTGTVTIFEPESVRDGCAQAADVCNKNSECVENAKGFCCFCAPPYYGNGYECLSPGVPQMLNGRVFGNLNGLDLNDNPIMHTYVVTTDGRSHSAISRIPASVGPAMQTLNTIGGITGWLFAVPISAKAKNGYMYTGGKFNRTARVTFQSVLGEEAKTVRINQVFYGPASVNNIRMETRIEGMLPDIPEDASVTIDDYTENFKKTARGTIKSFSQRKYRVNEVAYRYTWDNTIMFDECDDGEDPMGETMKMMVTRNYVHNSPENNVIRYTMTSKVGLAENTDPCSKDAKDCDENASCESDGDMAKCRCREGYNGDGKTCQDVNECERSPCDVNARCYNTPGSYQCRCLPGFTGDGRTCAREQDRCGNSACDTNAKCVYVDDLSPPVCQCNEGYRGDGLSCSKSEEVKCNEADICGDNAQCIFDPDLKDYVCECLDDFSGDGYSCERVDPGCNDCDSNAQCLFDITRGRQMCQCNPGYTGDGKRCSLIDVCGRCSRYARCVFSEESSEYQCVCIRGYEGDGNRCSRRDCREDPSMCAEEGGLCWLDKTRDKAICRCNIGFRGDGFRCERVGCDVYNDCGRNAKCVPVGKDKFVCQCEDGFYGDGRRCRAKGPTTCDVYNDCDLNALCVQYPDDPTRYRCQCKRGYQGDGKNCSRVAEVSCNEENFCDPNAVCYYDEKTMTYSCRCKGEYEGNGRVCRKRVITCNEVNNCDPNALCVYNPDSMSYSCRCNREYEGDGLVCRKRAPIDCRRNFRLCDTNAECVQGSVEGEFVCVCKPGYRGDGSSCSRVVREGNFLMYAQGKKIMQVSTDNRPGDYGQQAAYIQGQLAVGIDTDCRDGKVYWTDAARGGVMRANLDGSEMETILKDLKSPEGVAIDYEARNVFVTDSELEIIQVSKLNGSDAKTLVNTNMVNPRAIVLDISRGTVYWTDWNRNKPQIERMNMDGSERKILVYDGLRLPNGLAFDSFSQQLCWGDAGTKMLECVRADGSGRRTLVSDAGYPFGMAMINNVVYWTDWRRRSIPNININGDKENEPVALAIGGHGRLYGITAVWDQCPRVRSACALNNGGCSYLCLASANGGRTCACPDGLDPRLCQA